MEDDTFAFNTGIKEPSCASLTSVSTGGVSRDVLIDSGLASNLPVTAGSPSGSKQSF